MKKIGYYNVLLGAILCALILVACGSGSNTTSESGKGNAISGTLHISSGSSSFTSRHISQAKTVAPYSGSKVLLVNRIGNIIDVVDTDADGNFAFGGLEHNDYIVRVVDNETLSIVTEVKCSLVNGDDVTIAGVIALDGATWTLSFKANGSVTIQRESQQINARDLSDASEKTFDEVIAMRENGMGWGQIARLLSVSTMILGLVFEEGFANEKTTKVTAQNIGLASKPA